MEGIDGAGGKAVGRWGRERGRQVGESLRTWEETGTVWRGHRWKCWWLQDTPLSLSCVCVCEWWEEIWGEWENTVCKVTLQVAAAGVLDSERPICFSDVTRALQCLSTLWDGEDADCGRDLSKRVRRCEFLWKPGVWPSETVRTGRKMNDRKRGVEICWLKHCVEDHGEGGCYLCCVLRARRDSW